MAGSNAGVQHRGQAVFFFGAIMALAGCAVGPDNEPPDTEMPDQWQKALVAATTVLGVIPLVSDVFWVGMAVTIMAGLSFGSILTMFLIPVLYAMLYKVPIPSRVA